MDGKQKKSNMPSAYSEQNTLVETDQASQAVAQLDSQILDVTNKAAEMLNRDRERADDLYEEFLELFENGASSPEDKQQLNNAQEQAQKVTTNMITLMSAMVRLRTGEAKVQIANVQNNDGNSGLTREEMIEELDKRGK